MRRRRPGALPYWLERAQALEAKLDATERAFTAELKLKARTPAPLIVKARDAWRFRSLGPCTYCHVELRRPVQTVRASAQLYHLDCWRAVKAAKSPLDKPPSPRGNLPSGAA